MGLATKATRITVIAFMAVIISHITIIIQEVVVTTIIRIAAVARTVIEPCLLATKYQSTVARFMVIIGAIKAEESTIAEGTAVISNSN